MIASETVNVDPQHLRILEAVLFAATEPLDEATLTARLPNDADLPTVLAQLESQYAGHGVQLVRVAGKWAFRTASDLAAYMQVESEVPRRLSRAAIETMAIIAYHQPVTRAEIEEIRGVLASRGTLDLLMETGWIRPGRRRRTPGRPVTWVTTDSFLEHFNLESLGDLPGVDELRASGLLDARPSITPTLTAVGTTADEEADEKDNDPAEHEEL